MKYLKIFILALSYMATGCTEFVDTDLPPSQLTGEAVFADRATATAALANIYAGLRDQTLITGSSHGLGNLLGHYTDELDFYGSGTSYIFGFSNHSILSTNSEISTLWNRSYNLIYSCNSLLEGLEGNITIDMLDREQLQGEALFLRAFIHFYLTQLFGDIPYISGTDYNTNSKIGRMRAEEYHTRLVSDLGEAIGLLSPDYIASDRVRVNKYVAMALMARVQLFHGDWEASLAACNNILAKTDLYVWEDDLDQVFLKECKGTLWQLSPGSVGGNTLDAINFIFETGPPSNGALARVFMEGFAANDQRALHWTKTVTDGTNVWVHPYKYKARGITSSTLEHSVVFRLAELYLIRAEALMQLNNFDQAMDDLNKIRNRAGLSELIGLDKTGLEAAILHERKYELFTEFGHRWFDLKRFQKAGEVLGPIKSNWNPDHLVFPLPQEELLTNPNLNPQNDGY